MRHKSSKRQLGMVGKKRNKLFRNLAASMIKRGKIVTTEAKAKELKSYIDRLVTIAKKYENREAKERLHPFIYGKENIQKFVIKAKPKYAKRAGSCVRLVKLGQRSGDNTMEVRIEFI